jgi:hypothetical protein
MVLGAYFLGAIMCAQQVSVVSGERLYYLNQPESVRSDGLLAKFETQPADNTRIFFHFINKTGKTQEFVLHLNQSISKFRLGYATSPSPGAAGVNAAYNFLKCEPKQKDGGIEFKIKLQPQVVISGICEGFMPDKTQVTAYFGSVKENKLYQVKESVNVTENIDINLDKDNQVVRIGTKRKDFIDGDYGTTFKLSITSSSDKPKTYKLVMSPRGGHLSLCFKHNNTLLTTPVVPAKHHYTVCTFEFLPGSVYTFETILVGGYAYPVEFFIIPV